MKDCIFCKIISGEINTAFLYEDEICVAFKDKNPKAKTHLLILPKKHIASVAVMNEGDEQTIGHLVKCAKEIAENLNLPGYKLQINVGRDGGQEVFHIHIHLLSNYG
ncbi:HIT domain-containing protein [Candidatus Peregrinibacteria bacterium]|nr:HIT domain-containing protein [Candidatus Peregrinibacteria bacterium]